MDLADPVAGELAGEVAIRLGGDDELDRRLVVGAEGVDQRPDLRRNGLGRALVGGDGLRRVLLRHQRRGLAAGEQRQPHRDADQEQASEDEGLGDDGQPGSGAPGRPAPAALARGEGDLGWRLSGRGADRHDGGGGERGRCGARAGDEGGGGCRGGRRRDAGTRARPGEGRACLSGRDRRRDAGREPGRPRRRRGPAETARRTAGSPA